MTNIWKALEMRGWHGSEAGFTRNCAYECRRVTVSRGPIKNFVAKVLIAVTKSDVDVHRTLALTVNGHRLLSAHALMKGIGILDAGAPSEFDGIWKGNKLADAVFAALF